MTGPYESVEQDADAIDRSAASRREALERASEQYGVGAYLLSWVILLVWVCMVVLTSPARGVRWLFRARPHAEAVTGAPDAPDAPDLVAEDAEAEGAIEDWGEGPDIEPQSIEAEPIVVPRSAVPGAYVAVSSPIEPLESAAETVAIESDDLEALSVEPEGPPEFDAPDESVDADGEPISAVPSWYRRPELGVAVVYLQLLVIAELLVIGWSQFGPAAHFALIAVLLLHRWRTSSPGRATLLLVLILPSVVRIASLAALQVEIDPVWRPLLVAGPVLAAAYLVYRRSGLTRFEVGCARWDLSRQMPIALLGLPLGLIEFAIVHPGPLLPDRALASVVVASLVLCGGAAAYELVFRGLLQGGAARSFGAWPAIVVTAVMGGVLRLGNSSTPELVFALAMGLLFGWLAYRTRSILVVSLAHGVGAIVLLVLAPLGLLPLSRALPTLVALIER